MKDIVLLELFSGIGGFTKGLEEAGFNIKKHYYSEVDKHSIANYKYNYPNGEHIGSVRDVHGRNLERPDIITFGSPCQDFSLAGKQNGLNGKRSVLIFEAIRLLRECQPGVFIWENVKGTFSSNDGEDFWAILNAFTNIGNYRLEWQLLNTDWVLPQNRERIYLVGHLTGRSIGKVFPFTENDRLSDKSKKSKKGRTQTKSSTTLKASGAMKADDAFIETPKKAGCLTGGANSGGLHSDMTVIPVLTPNRKDKRQNGRRFKEDGESAFTINCQDQNGVMFTKNYLQYDISGKGHKSQQDGAFYENGNMGCIPSSKTECKVNILTNESKIRRLTEIECERLQGFPDDWTKYGNYDGEIKEISKTQRYRMCGNAVTTKIVKAIGEKIELI